jgi:hypothetical protein
MAVPLSEKTISNAKREVMGDRDNRRSAMDRRRFSYDLYIPDRRSGIDRRSNSHRGMGQAQ